MKHLWLTPHDVFECIHLTCGFVDFVQPRDLNEPSDVVRQELVVDDPFSQLVPFVQVSRLSATREGPTHRP